MKLNRILFMILLAGSLSSRAQNKLTIDKVYSVVLKNSGTINENDQVKGYYFLYQSDKIDKKTNEYTLQIVDENLNRIKDIKFTDSKDILLLESSFNGSSIAFLFYNDKENTLDYRLYSMDGKASYTYSKELDKKSEAMFKARLAANTSEESENNNVYDIPGKGFLSVTPIRESKNYTYDICFYASGKRKTWTYNPVEEGKFSDAQFLGANDSIALLEVLTREKLLSHNMESTIIGINLENGRKVFEMRSQDGRHQLYPMNISKLRGSNEFLLMGPYYDGSDRVVQDKSEGLGIWQMNNQGKIIKTKYLSWDRDMSKYLNVDEKGRVEDMGYVYIHKLMQTDDGRIFVVGEGYKKAADAGGIAMNVLMRGYGSGMTKLVITNMLMLQLSGNFDLQNAKIYEKNRNNFSLGTASDFVSPHTLALMAKSYGAFDYIYTQMGKDNGSFVSAYTDYEKSKDYKGLTFHSISYYDGKLSTDKINLKTDASRMIVMPAKSGFVMIMEYFRKDKRMELRMEKVN
jgi:hypothetical protein